MRITQAALELVHAHASEGYPHEVCGVLTRQPGSGVVSGARRLRNIMEREEWTRDPYLVKVIQEVFPAMSNLERARDRYLMDPREQMQVERECDAAGLEVAGFYHSHPDHPARASVTDAERSWAGYFYLIVRCDQGKVSEGNVFVADRDHGPMRQEEVEVLEGSQVPPSNPSP